MKCAIYKENNQVIVLIPSKEALENYTVYEIAVKDVPAGKPFGIVDFYELPNEPQDSWTVEETDLTDGVGGEVDMFVTDPQHPDYVAPEGELIEGDTDVTG